MENFGVGVIGATDFAVPLEISKLGAQFGTDTTDPAGVRAVTARGPAAGAALRPGDTIGDVDGQGGPDVAVGNHSSGTVSIRLYYQPTHSHFCTSAP